MGPSGPWVGPVGLKGGKGKPFLPYHLSGDC